MFLFMRASLCLQKVFILGHIIQKLCEYLFNTLREIELLKYVINWRFLGMIIRIYSFFLSI